MKYTLINRKQSTVAKNNEEFVRWMRKTDMQSFASNSDFMEAYAFRKSSFEKINLRYGNEDDFVEDLQNHEMLEIEKREKKWNIFK